MPRSLLHAAGLVGVLFVAASCDVRALRQEELTGARDASPAGTDADANATADIPNRDDVDSTGGGDAVPSCPATPCEAFEICEPSTMTCVPRTGPGKLSGSVRDACTGQGTTARLGIAGRRQCSVDSKGSYYFENLPEGNLALIAFKEGYKHFEVAVSITAAGTIQDIVLQPDTPRGCADPLPANVTCVCNIPGCP